MLQGLPLLSTAGQLEEVNSFLSTGGPAADVPPLVKARYAEVSLFVRPHATGTVRFCRMGSVQPILDNSNGVKNADEACTREQDFLRQVHS